MKKVKNIISGKSSLPLNILLFLLSFQAFAQSSISGVVNQYYEVTAINYCPSEVTLMNVSGLSPGDQVLIIQMQGATIIQSNTSSFGDITALNEAGRYEWNEVAAINGQSVIFSYFLENQYSTTGKVQLVKVPTYKSVTVADTLTVDAWNGQKGGVLALSVNDTLILNELITVTAKGFRGGQAQVNLPNNCSWAVSNDDYFYASGTWRAADKGEGVAHKVNGMENGRGAQANAGGGGNDHNSGGGGGANAGNGGDGGENQEPGTFNCKGYYPGLGGYGLTYSNYRIFMGGGGGAGHTNNQSLPNGGDGGGVIIIRANTVIGNNQIITANGADGTDASNDGAGGGGGAGTILLEVQSFVSNLTLSAEGGDGGSTTNMVSRCYGPGGGGSGGAILITSPSLPAIITTSTTGGINGLSLAGACPNQANNASPGNSGSVFYNQKLDGGSTPNKTDFTNAGSDTTVCLGDSLQLSGTGGNTFQWTPSGTLNNDTIANPWAFPSGKIQFILSSSVGLCSDADTITVNVNQPPIINIIGEDTICQGEQITLIATGADSFLWSPSAGLNDTSTHAPVASPNISRIYSVTGIDSIGCKNTAQFTMIVIVRNELQTSADTVICEGENAPLSATEAESYTWSPATSLDNPQSNSPIASPLFDQHYTVIGTYEYCPDDTGYVQVDILNSPLVDAGTGQQVNSGANISLHATTSNYHFVQYFWEPASGLSNPNSEVTNATVTATTIYTVTATTPQGCTASDSVIIQVSDKDNKWIFTPNAFSPNADGLNDIFRIKGRAGVTFIEMDIYNRWGVRVFHSENNNMSWNGNFRGEEQPMGTYIYIIRLRTPDGRELQKSGNVTLLR